MSAEELGLPPMSEDNKKAVAKFWEMYDGSDESIVAIFDRLIKVAYEVGKQNTRDALNSAAIQSRLTNLEERRAMAKVLYDFCERYGFTEWFRDWIPVSMLASMKELGW